VTPWTPLQLGHGKGLGGRGWGREDKGGSDRGEWKEICIAHPLLVSFGFKVALIIMQNVGENGRTYSVRIVCPVRARRPLVSERWVSGSDGCLLWRSTGLVWRWRQRRWRRDTHVTTTTLQHPHWALASHCNNLRILLVYSRHTDSRAFWGHLRQTYCRHSLHRQTLLLVGSHAAPTPFGTVFLHLYALLTVSLVLGLSSRPTCSRDICSRSTVRASDTLMQGC